MIGIIFIHLLLLACIFIHILGAKEIFRFPSVSSHWKPKNGMQYPEVCFPN